MGVKIAAADIDWLTFSTKAGGTTDRLLEIGAELCERLVEQKGHTVKPTQVLGYSGTSCGQLFVGCREDGGLMRVSGGTTPYVAAYLLSGGLHGNITRLDYAVTVQFETDRADYAQTTAEGLSTSSSRQARHRQASLALHRGFGGGDTCTIGARSSARYLRLYDKTREQNGQVEPNLWRFEVEYKKPLSTFMWELYADADERPRIVMQRVKAEFEYQQVSIPWADDTEVERIKVAVDKTTIERKLAWLRDQVAPSVRWLEREGYGQEARAMLGLTCGENSDSVQKS